MKHMTRPLLSRKRNDIKPMAIAHRKIETIWRIGQTIGGALLLLICILSCIAIGVMWDMILRAHYF